MSRLTMAFALSVSFVGASFAQESRPAAPQFPPLGAPAGTFGEGVDVGERTKLPDVAKAPNEFEGKTIRVEGAIDDVCKKKGCWMVVNDGGEAVRVRFKDYGFFVPRDAKGRRTIVQGTAVEEEISEEMAKHYAEEGGNPEEAENIKGPQKVISFTATGVVILGSDDLPLEADRSGEVMPKVAERASAGETIADGGAEAVEDLAGALAVLRATPATQTSEFAICVELEEWFVFGRVTDHQDAFASSVAVARADGRVVAAAN